MFYFMEERWCAERKIRNKLSAYFFTTVIITFLYNLIKDQNIRSVLNVK